MRTVSMPARHPQAPNVPVHAVDGLSPADLPGNSVKDFGDPQADDDGNKYHQKLEQAQVILPGLLSNV